MQKWEYKVIDLIKEIKIEGDKSRLLGRWLRAADIEIALNKLGAQGWELVNIHFDRQETIVVGFFKRSLLDSVE